MRYRPLTSKLYSKNRDYFTRALEPGGLAVFNSNDIYPISADSTLPFAQHRDIFYLSGIDQEESILLLFPNAPKLEHREILFIKKTSDLIAVWEGQKLTKKQATALSGIETVYWLDEFEDLFEYLANEAQIFYFNTNEHYRAKVETQTREDRFIKWAKAKFPNHPTAKSNFILQKLRSVKDLDEISKELSQSMGAILKFDYKVDEELIGGLKLQLGSFMIDTSIKNKLKKYKQLMLES